MIKKRVLARCRLEEPEGGQADCCWWCGGGLPPICRVCTLRTWVTCVCMCAALAALITGVCTAPRPGRNVREQREQHYPGNAAGTQVHAWQLLGRRNESRLTVWCKLSCREGGREPRPGCCRGCWQCDCWTAVWPGVKPRCSMEGPRPHDHCTYARRVPRSPCTGRRSYPQCQPGGVNRNAVVCHLHTTINHVPGYM